MSRSGGIGQLIKGVFIGIVLILAVIGTMSMLEKNGDTSSSSATLSTTPDNISIKKPAPEIQAPEISLTPQKPVKPSSEKKTPDDYIPVLEGEKSVEEIKKLEKDKSLEAIKYGIVKLTTINPDNNENLKANYVVIDSKNIKVAESKNISKATFRLPIGRYKVTTELISATEKSTPIQTTQSIVILDNKTSDHIFKLEPPPTLGVLQVSASNAKTKQAMKANFIIQKENGETIATRQNVSRSLFKLKAGSYKVTVSNGNNSDFRTIVVTPGESVSEAFSLQESFLQGRVLVRVFDIKSNKPIKADIRISTDSGKVIQELKSVSKTEIALSSGNYKISVTGSNSRSTKNISVVAGKSISEIFRLDAPKVIQITDNVKITGVEKEQPTSNNNKEQQTQENQFGTIKLIAQNAGDRKPLKSNFYIQTPNGKNIDKKIYANNANFKLKPGKYKITIRSKNRKNIVKNIHIFAGQTVTEVFPLQKPNVRKPAPTTPSPTKHPKIIPNGFLNVVMQPARNTHFIIANRVGKKIVELTSVPSGNFKLDTGIYNVTAIFNNQRRKKTVQVHQGKTTRINFNAFDFQTKRVINNVARKGVLRSRIVDNAGRPLRGDLTVTNQQGKVVARANGVTVGLFNLPPAPHTVIVNYRGLSGSEKVKITAGQTTVQTFTISPTNTRATQAPAQRTNTRNPKDILRDKIEDELRRIF